MLDISRLFLRKAEAQAASIAPAVHSVIARKGAGLETAKAVLTKAGFDMSKPSENASAIVFAQKAGDPSADAILIKSTDDIGFVVEGLAEGFKKSFSGYDFQSTEFNDVFATGSFVPSVSMASDLLSVAVGNILSSSETPGDAATKIGKAVDGFKQYAVTLANALPVQAFKAEQQVRKTDPAMTLRGSGSTSYLATVDDKKNTGVNDPKPNKSLADSESMKGFMSGLLGGGDSAQAWTLDDVTDAGSGSQSNATSDDKGAVGSNPGPKSVSGGKINIGKSLKDPDNDGDNDQADWLAKNKDKGAADWKAMDPKIRMAWSMKNKGQKAKKAEADNLRKSAATFAASGDHGTATTLYKSAEKIEKAVGGEDEEELGAAAQKLADNQSGAGASSTNTGANVKKSTTEIAVMVKSAGDFAAAGQHNKAFALYKQADAALKVLKDNGNGGVSSSDDLSPSQVTSGNGTSVAATEDDANNTAVGATKRNPDKNLEAPAGMDTNGWTGAVKAEMNNFAQQMTKALTSAIGEIRKDVAGLGARIDKAEEAVNGTVIGAPMGERLGFSQFEKSDNGNIPLLDTAIRKSESAFNVHEIREFALRRRAM